MSFIFQVSAFTGQGGTQGVVVVRSNYNYNFQVCTHQLPLGCAPLLGPVMGTPTSRGASGFPGP